MAFSYPIPLNVEGIQINKTLLSLVRLRVSTWQDPPSRPHLPMPTTIKHGCIPEASQSCNSRKFPLEAVL